MPFASAASAAAATASSCDRAHSCTMPRMQGKQCHTPIGEATARSGGADLRTWMHVRCIMV